MYSISHCSSRARDQPPVEVCGAGTHPQLQEEVLLDGVRDGVVVEALELAVQVEHVQVGRMRQEVRQPRVADAARQLRLLQPGEAPRRQAQVQPLVRLLQRVLMALKRYEGTSPSDRQPSLGSKWSFLMGFSRPL